MAVLTAVAWEKSFLLVKGLFLLLKVCLNGFTLFS